MTRTYSGFKQCERILELMQFQNELRASVHVSIEEEHVVAVIETFGEALFVLVALEERAIKVGRNRR